LRHRKDRKTELRRLSTTAGAVAEIALPPPPPQAKSR